MKISNVSRLFGLIAVTSLLPALGFANEPPVAQILSKTVKEDKTIKIALKGTDPERKKLTFAISQQPQQGGVTLKGSTVTYKPPLNYNGSDSFQFTANDGELTSAPAAVNITVQAVNDRPTITSKQTLFVQQGATALITLKASDIENDPLTYLISAKPKKGKIGKPSGNTVTYTPNPAKKKKAAYKGPDSFSYKVKDGKKSSKVVKIKLVVADKCPLSSEEFKNGVCYANCKLPEILQDGQCVGPNVGFETLSITKTGKGFVTSSPEGINCGEDCAAFFPEKSVITLTATADAKSTFSGWIGGGCGNDATCTITLNSGEQRFTEVVAGFTARFNDTGITSCADNTASGLGCPLTAFSRQDGDFGRDKLFNDDSNGHAGFNFTKIGSNGQALAIQNVNWSDTGTEEAGSRWSCVKDNVTGLLWEVKTGDGLHNVDTTYDWSGAASLANDVNAAGWCGRNDGWRVPTRSELTGLIDYSRATAPAVDVVYFPTTNAQSAFLWTSSAFAFDADSAWNVSADKGASADAKKSTKYSVRLVRSAE